MIGTFSARQVTQTCKRGADLGPRPLAEVLLCREEMRVCIGVRREPVLWEMRADIPVSSPLMPLSGPPDTTQSCRVPALSPDTMSEQDWDPV